MKRTILVRGVDEGAYRRAKAAAALKGVPIGSAVSEALEEWARGSDTAAIDREARADREFVRRSWGRLRAHRGKVAVVQGGRLRGVFDDQASAREFSSQFDVALLFTVDAPPAKKVLEIGAEMAL
ncbi:MAG: hypothetical protein JRN63_00055 [Nitrososphaerota archaeon]|jgi:hypothetical protein|nr:hypothetical protein [Nitrososphaerota archaeon]